MPDLSLLLLLTEAIEKWFDREAVRCDVPDRYAEWFGTEELAAALLDALRVESIDVLITDVERLRRLHQGQAEHIVALRTELDRLSGEGP